MIIEDGETSEQKEQVKGCTRLQIGVAKKCSVQISNYMYQEFIDEYNAILVTANMLDFKVSFIKRSLDLKVYFENIEQMKFFMLTFHRYNHGEIKEISVEKCQPVRNVQYTLNPKYKGQFIKSLQTMKNAIIEV